MKVEERSGGTCLGNDARLCAIDAGFDPRFENLPIKLPASENLHIGYDQKGGSRAIVSGPRAEVIGHLREAGYNIVD